MTLLRIGLVVALCVGGVVACTPGGPERASDIQNVNGISDDISARTMTDTSARSTHDPNLESTLPNNFQTTDSDQR
ncbi:MAG TPA: hypothetical protein VNV38_06600 [Stellaceae bacterium]|jgi:hypothetical protein|nr:hypothetical protein [Stellaceae bacterium]